MRWINRFGKIYFILNPEFINMYVIPAIGKQLYISRTQL